MKTQKVPKHFLKSSIQFFKKMQLYIGFAAIVTDLDPREDILKSLCIQSHQSLTEQP